MWKMGGGKTSSSSSTEHLASVTERDLLEFYRKHFDELQNKDNKYKDKVDKHLRELIADRHELESEVLRRGEKISDLQKALVDLQLSCFEERERFLNVSAENERLKKNEEKLHESIRHLLNLTKDKELRDKIIYILQDPKVEIGIRYNSKAQGSSSTSVGKAKDELFKEQIQKLQSKLDEHSKVSQTKSDVILEDCKLALEKSKAKLLNNEEEIAFLRKRLQDAENELSKVRQVHTAVSENHYSTEPTSSQQFSSANNYSATSDNIENSNRTGKPFNNIRSSATDLHLTLILLSKIINKVLSILTTIQSSQVYVEAAKLPKSKASSQAYIFESDVIQLQNCIRQCTRLSFDVTNLLKSLNKVVASGEVNAQGLDMEWELKELEAAVEELAVATAEADLLCISLSRATFFDYLTGPKKTFEKFGVKEKNNHSKYVSDVSAVEANLKAANNYTAQSLKFVERIMQKCSTFTRENHSQVDSDLYRKLHSSRDNRDSNEKFSKVQKPTGLDANKFNREVKEKEKNFSTLEMEDLTRKINKALAKINQLENGEYIKDDEFCQHLAEQVNSLAEKLKELYSEFNVKNLRDQFSEYSSLTLSKLEALAKQSRSAVIAAEAQISAHRDNARALSQKLRDTEELLRESINECLVLKQKLQLEKLNREMDKSKFSRELHEKLHRISDFDDLETAVKEVATSIDPRKESAKSYGPYECLYCKQGSEHKLCIEKIRELRASNRKLATELKLLQQELKEDKKLSQMSQEQALKTVHELSAENRNLKETLKSLEAKNSSILEQLKLERNRLKNMERFRRLEIEGFQTDIKNLKTKIQDMEKQLTKAVLIFEHDKKDLELLKTIHTTAQNSKQATGAIRRLKAKLYELENDIKHL